LFSALALARSSALVLSHPLPVYLAGVLGQSTYPQHLAIGVTTAQNVANLLPVLQLGLGRYRAWSSPTALAQHWDAGLAEVLRGAGCSVSTTIDVPDGPVTDVVRGLVASVTGEPRVCWLVGGGQKVHTLAMWQALERRWRDGCVEDVGVYADPHRRLVVFRRGPDGEVEEEDRALDAPRLTLQMVFGCFRRALKDGRAPAVSDELRYDHYLRDGSLRAACFERTNPSFVVEQRFATVAALVNGLPDEGLRPPDAVVEDLARQARHKWKAWSEGTDPYRTLARRAMKEGMNPKNWATSLGWKPRDRFAGLFERLVQARVEERLRGVARVAEVRRNVVCSAPESPGTTEAEHDVLVAFRDGTVLSLDAKTFEVTAKDLRARQRALEAGAGSFARFVPVLSLHADDLEAPWLPRDAYGRAIKTAAELRTETVVVSPNPIGVDPDGKLVKLEPGERVGSDWLRAETLDRFLDRQLR
jgi:hypothetical protein